LSVKPYSNLYIIGPMGAGKTTVGKALASLLRMDFLDSDRELEHTTGVDIQTIFDLEGETGFRRREQQIIARLTEKRNLVLATGGGTILSEDNRKALRKSGTVIYLAATVEMQLKRTRHSSHRPLLQTENPRQLLEQLMAEREPLYLQEADIIVTTSNQSSKNVAREIINRLEAQ